MFNFDYVTNEDIKKHNLKWTEIPDHLHQILGRLWLHKNKWITKSNNEPDIDKIHLYAKDPYEVKYKLLINKRESTGLKYLNNLKPFIEFLNDLDDICKNIEECNPNKKEKISISFDDMIRDMLSNKN